MPEYRRAFVPGGTFFFTAVTYRRRPLFLHSTARRLLGSVIRRCQLWRPFEINAIVLLPDHLHSIWSLPRGDSNYSSRWNWIKREFTRHWLGMGQPEGWTSPGKKHERRRGIWQSRFWEHTLLDVEDFDRHFDYIHYNPVKHQLVASVSEWHWSSFHRWVRRGIYPEDWGRGTVPLTQQSFSPHTVGEA